MQTVKVHRPGTELQVQWHTVLSQTLKLEFKKKEKKNNNTEKLKIFLTQVHHTPRHDSSIKTSVT